MARRPRSAAPAMETRVSIADPRVTFVPVPDARRLMVFDVENIPAATHAAGALVWLRPGKATVEDVKWAVGLFEGLQAVVRVLPREAEDSLLPAEAGSPAPTSDVSEVRPVVAELVAELPEALRVDVAALCDRHLSEAEPCR